MKPVTLTPFAVAFIAIATLAWTAGRSVQVIIDREAWLRHTYIVHDGGARFFSRFRDATAALQLYLASDVPIAEVSYRREIDSCFPILSELEALTRDNPSQRARVSRLIGLVSDERTFMQSQAEARETTPLDGVVPPRTHAIQQRHDQRIEDVRVIDNQFLHEEERLLAERTELVNVANARTRWIIGLMCAASFLVIVGAFFIVVRELRLRRRLEEKLVRQNLRLESEVRTRTIEITKQAENLLMINAELQHFAKLASHDLQEPLRTISVFCGKLSQNPRGHFDVETCQDMELVIQAAKKMRQLILDVITYSHVQNHSNVFTEILLEDSLVEVIKNLHSEIHDSAAVVQYARLPPLFSDRRLLIWLMQNLIGNSLKYRGEHAPQIHITSQRMAHAWEISVADNGIGIAPRHHERVFELFKRLHGPGHYSGTGLGLALCKRIVELHGGRIWIQSELGSGATVRFTIPDRADAA